MKNDKAKHRRIRMEAEELRQVVPKRTFVRCKDQMKRSHLNIKYVEERAVD
jgi:hypothetical protein